MRSVTLNFTKMLFTWALTVSSAIESRWAICLFANPSQQTRPRPEMALMIEGIDQREAAGYMASEPSNRLRGDYVAQSRNLNVDRSLR